MLVYVSLHSQRPTSRLNTCLQYIQVEADDEHASLEEEWNLMQESILDSMVNVHNQLFGSIDLVFSVSHL